MSGKTLLGLAVTARLNDVQRWVYWGHGTEARPEEVKPEQIRYEMKGAAGLTRRSKV